MDNLIEAMLDDDSFRETLKEFLEGQLTPKTLWNQMHDARERAERQFKQDMKEQCDLAPYESEDEDYYGDSGVA